MILNKLKRISYKFLPDKYFCPVCRNEINHFEPLPSYYINNLKKNGFIHDISENETLNIPKYHCPLCKSTDRNRLIALYFEKNGCSDNSTIYDIGPSKSLSGYFKNRFKNYFTIDLHKPADFREDILSLSFSDNSTDFVICSHVLEHLEDDSKAVKEIYRILKPRGKAVFLSPVLLNLQNNYENKSAVSDEERWKHFGQFDHHRIYSVEGFSRLITSSGFKLHRLGKDFFGEEIFKKSGITLSSVLYIGEKH